MTQLLQNAVFGTALILAAALLRRALGGRLIPEARLALWFVCLIRLLAPVFPDSGLSLWGLLPRAGSAAATAPVMDPLPVPSGAGANLPAVNAPASGTMNPGLVPVEPTGAAFPWETVALSLWIGVGLLLAVRYVLRWNRTRRAVADAIPLPKDDPRYAPLPKCARLREGVMDGAPLTFGAARPTVVLWPGLSGAALDCVLAHEGVHARRRDNLWHYAMALVLVVYWWNPAVWLMARLLRRDIELACDRAAVRRLGAERRAQYAETLVALATVGAEPAFCRTFGRKAAEERILSVMKFKKTTVLGVVLSLVLVAGVTVAFASGPKVVPNEDSTTSTAPSTSVWRMSTDGNHGLRYFALNLDYLEQSLNKQVAGGSMTREEADRIVGQARALSGNGEELEWVFQEDSGLVQDSFDEDGNYRPGFNVFYKDADGKLTPVDPATVVSGFILPAAEENGWAEVVVYRGRAYNRADLSAETLEWLDWYLALSEEERLAVSYEPWELRDGEAPTNTSPLIVEDGDPDVTPPRPVTLEEYGILLEGLVSGGKLSREDADWFLANAKEDMEGQECPYLWVVDGGSYAVMGGNICTLADCGNNSRHTHDGEWYTGWTNKQAIPPYCTDEDCNLSGLHYHQQDGEVVYCYDTLPAEIPVCPVEGCTVQGVHYHDGVIYRCNGAHCGGVCDGSCAAAWNGADTAPTNPPVSSGHHGAGHGNGYQGGHH